MANAFLMRSYIQFQGDKLEHSKPFYVWPPLKRSGFKGKFMRPHKPPKGLTCPKIQSGSYCNSSTSF